MDKHRHEGSKLNTSTFTLSPNVSKVYAKLRSVQINCHVLKISRSHINFHMFFSLPRLKLLIDQEKTHQERKEEENNKKVTNLKDELTKLKSFALLVVDEQQRLAEQWPNKQRRSRNSRIRPLRLKRSWAPHNPGCKKEENKVLRLEEELRNQACHFHQEQEAMTAKLTNEDAQNRQLRQKLSTLSRQLDELGETNKTLHRAEEELLELRDKISRGECGKLQPNDGGGGVKETSCSKWRGRMRSWSRWRRCAERPQQKAGEGVEPEL